MFSAYLFFFFFFFVSVELIFFWFAKFCWLSNMLLFQVIFSRFLFFLPTSNMLVILYVFIVAICMSYFRQIGQMWWVSKYLWNIVFFLCFIYSLRVMVRCCCYVGVSALTRKRILSRLDISLFFFSFLFELCHCYIEHYFVLYLKFAIILHRYRFAFLFFSCFVL